MASGAPAASAARAATATRSGAAAGVRSLARAVLDQSNLPPVDIRAVQFVQSPLHVRVGPELYNSLVGAFLVGICIGHFSCLTHKVL